MSTLKKLATGTVLALALLAVVALLLPVLVPGLHSTSLPMVLNVMSGRGHQQASDALLDRLHTVKGYSVTVFARDLAHPRMLALDASGRLLVSNPRGGTVTLLEDGDGDSVAETRKDLMTGLKNPHGIALHKGYLYIAESHQVGRVPYQNGEVQGDYTVIIEGLTDNGNHWTKSIAFDEQGQLFLSMGSTCNVCEEADARRATIMRFDADGSNGRIYASGLRNSVGLAFSPLTGSLFATDNGRDLLGDDFPPCELNEIVEGGFYGWPYRNGDNVADPDFGNTAPELESTARPPQHYFPAHNAPLGISFLPNQQRALVALHGSWNRSQPDGYKVVQLDWLEGGIQQSDYLWGFELDGDIVGRPVDVVPDGAGGVFVSDDYAKVIYKVAKGERKTNAANSVATQQQGEATLDGAQVAAGQTLFDNMPCGSCHDRPVNSRLELRGLSRRYDVDTLAAFFLTPTPPMPRFSLSDEERLQLAHYLLSTRG